MPSKPLSTTSSTMVNKVASLKALKKSRKPKNLKEHKDFKTYFEDMAAYGGYAPNSPGMNADHSNVQEGEYADSQDETLVDSTDKKRTIESIIQDLEDLKHSHDWNHPLNGDLIKAMAETLHEVGVKPEALLAAIDTPGEHQEELLYKALAELKALVGPDIDEDDSNVSTTDSAVPGDASTTTAAPETEM